MKILDYRDPEVYTFRPEDFNKTIFFFEEGALIVSEKDIQEDLTFCDFETLLTMLFSGQLNQLADGGFIEADGSGSD